MTRKKGHPAEGLLAHCPWHSIRLGTKASRPETNGTISWQRQANRASCTTIADAMSKTEVAAVKGSALQSQTQHAAMNDAARCDGQRTALQHRTQNSGLGRGVPIVAPTSALPYVRTALHLHTQCHHRHQQMQRGTSATTLVAVQQPSICSVSSLISCIDSRLSIHGQVISWQKMTPCPSRAKPSHLI